jgi:hypothetical protein
MDQTTLAAILAALAAELEASGAERLHLVVCGGAALNALGLIERPTLDVDVVALIEAHAGAPTTLTPADPMPAALVAAAARVASNFDLPDHWLNPGPTELLRFGLTAGFEGRLVRRRYGRVLDVSFLGRFDLVCLKLYALADTGPGKHEQDLRALAPSAGELEEAARWCRGHDPSPGFLACIRNALLSLGANDVAGRIS